MQNQSNKIAELQQDIVENKFKLNEQKQEIQLLKVSYNIFITRIYKSIKFY